VSRDSLVPFLQHQLREALAELDPKWLRIWHVCVTLLGRLGHKVSRNVYERIDGHCAECEGDDARFVAFMAQLRRMEADGLEWGDFATSRDLLAWFGACDADVLARLFSWWCNGRRSEEDDDQEDAHSYDD
jgi:hypothetical protein